MILSVDQSPGKLYVYAVNNGNHVAIIDNIILSINYDWGSSHVWFYEDDFYFGSGRIGANGAGARMVEMNYAGGGIMAHATDEYWEVDQRVKSLPINIS
jgi:hypothetical protein